MIPSISWCGSISASSRSLNVPGSPSSWLTTTYFGKTSFGTKVHLTPVGNPAPPSPSQAGVLHELDQIVGSHRRDGLRAPRRKPPSSRTRSSVQESSGNSRSRRMTTSASEPPSAALLRPSRSSPVARVGSRSASTFLGRYAGLAPPIVGELAPMHGLARSASECRPRGLASDLLRRLDRLAADAGYVVAALERSTSSRPPVGTHLVEVLVVDLQARRPVARRETFGGLEREPSVRPSSRRPRSPACSSSASMTLRAPMVRARDVAADRDQVVALRLLLQHRVEAARREDLSRREAEELGDLAHPLFGHVALDRLDEEQQRQGRPSASSDTCAIALPCRAVASRSVASPFEHLCILTVTGRPLP